MESKAQEKQKKEEEDVVIKMEETEDTKALTGPPTLDEMVAALTLRHQDPNTFRRFVNILAEGTPQAPPELYGDDFRNWESRHLLTATLSHLVAIFKHKDNPRQSAWSYYDAFLKVNNTDYRDSPFIFHSSAKALFAYEAEGRRKCNRVAAGFRETEKKGKRKSMFG